MPAVRAAAFRSRGGPSENDGKRGVRTCGAQNVGTVRDHVWALTLLKGREASADTRRTGRQNVAGYDGPRLIVGSLGILGVIARCRSKYAGV